MNTIIISFVAVLKNKIMKKLFLIACVILAAQFSFAQTGAKIVFEENVHDYGKVKEDGGVQVHVFTFKNTGSEPLIIHNVTASCGCAKPEWNKQPLEPQNKGKTKVTFDPRARVGTFTKAINIHANTNPGLTRLIIKGEVLPRERTLEEQYPVVMGPIRFKTSHMSLGSIFNTSIKSDSLVFLNNSEEDVTVTVRRSPGHIKLEMIPPVVKPGKFGKIMVNYDATKSNRFGYASDRVYLYINEQENYRYAFNVSGTINEDFSNLSEEELSKAPKISFNEKSFEFGTINQGETVNHTFTIKNEGVNDLIIRNVKTSCGCTTGKLSSERIPGGEKITMDVTFKSAGKRGRQNKAITIISNDPKNSTEILRVIGVVNVN